MQAIEFVTKEENGLIKIPKQYLENLHKEFRVIILIDEPMAKKTVIKKFTAAKIKTKNIKLSRDEANER
jgi:hypothetical protein